MNDANPVPASYDDRQTAALAHASAIFPFLGAIVPILIWMTRKERSQYLAYHAMQAILFQVSIMITWFLGGLCYIFSILVLMMALPFVISDSGDIAPRYLVGSFVPFIIVGIILVVGLAYIIYGIVGAATTYQGKPFRYIIVGKWAERIAQSRQPTSAANTPTPESSPAKSADR